MMKLKNRGIIKPDNSRLCGSPWQRRISRQLCDGCCTVYNSVSECMMNNCIKNLISAGRKMSIQYRRLIMHGKSQRRQEMDLNQSTWILILYSRTEHDATLSFSLPPLTFFCSLFLHEFEGL